MNKLKSLAIATFSVLSISASMADEINGIQYNSIDIGYGRSSLEGDSDSSKIVFDTLKGTGFSGTYRVDNFLIGGSYYDAKSNGVTVDGTAVAVETKLRATSFSLGYRFGISQGFDLVPSISHSSQKVTAKRNGAADQNSDSSANAVEISARNKLTNNLQSTVGFGRSSDEVNAVSAGLLYKLDKSWGVRGTYSRATGADNYKSNQTTISLSYLF